MFEYLYEWLRNLAFYLVLVTALTHVLPAGEYRKYIRFFTGLVLILMLLTPILRLFDAQYRVEDIYEGYHFEESMREIKEKMDELDGEIQDEVSKKIEVEAIVVGP